MSNELIVHIVKDIQEDVKQIKVQTTKTNGRVSSIENWRSFITGAISVLGALIVPIFLAMVYSYFKGG